MVTNGGGSLVELNAGGPGGSTVEVVPVVAITGGPRVDLSVGGPGVWLDEVTVCEGQVVTNGGGPRVDLKVKGRVRKMFGVLLYTGGPGVVGTVGGPGVVTT